MGLNVNGSMFSLAGLESLGSINHRTFAFALRPTSKTQARNGARSCPSVMKTTLIILASALVAAVAIAEPAVPLDAGMSLSVP